jgi:hypothetical protein
MDLKEDMEVSSDDEKYLVPGYKPAKEEEPDDEPDWAQIYAAGIEDSLKDMPPEQLKKMFVQIKLEQKKKKMADEAAAAGGKQYKTGKWDPIHDMILVNPVVNRVKEDMEELQKTNPLALWWVVEWGKEYLARFRNCGGTAAIADLDNYQSFTYKQKDRVSMKVLAGMTDTVKGAGSQPASGAVTPTSVPATPGSATSSKKAKKSAGSPFVESLVLWVLFCSSIVLNEIFLLISWFMGGQKRTTRRYRSFMSIVRWNPCLRRRTS